MELLGNLTDDEDFLELVDIVQHPRKTRVFRDGPNHFEVWDDLEFKRRFRVSKDCVLFIINRIADIIEPPTERNHAIKAPEMVCLTLRYFATGSFLQVVGDFSGIDKSTASRIVSKVARAIAGLYEEFVRMPSTEEEMNTTSQEFYSISRFPQCIGALDCTHVRITSPGGNEPEIFRNRKDFFSLNVQAVCDAGGKFENVVCRWPGSAHDSTIFSNSRLRAQFEHGNYLSRVLVGDSGYGIKNYLITPLRNPHTGPEILFNESQIRTRNPIERYFGVWKRRFPVLAFGIRIKLEKVESVVIATAVLHNIACLMNDPMPPVNAEEEAAVGLVNNMPPEVIRAGLERGGHNNSVRDQLVNEYFNRLLD